MTAPHADQLIDGYLARLRVAGAYLPSTVRDELIEDMRSHIAEARARESDETDATILNILDRLGDPELLVAEARQRPSAPQTGQPLSEPRPYGPGVLEIATVVLLPFLWIIGVILLWVSPAWKTRDKVIGSLFSIGGYPAIFIILAAFGHHAVAVSGSGNSCTSSADAAGNITQTVCTGVPVWQVIGTILSVVVFMVVLLLPVITSAYLAIRLRWGRPQQTAMA